MDTLKSLNPLYSNWLTKINTQKPLILLITDSPYYPIFFEHHLEDYEILIRDSSISFDEIKKIHPNYLVIDDHLFKDKMLPFCLKIREENQFHHTPLLIISGNLKKTYIKHLYELGVNGVIQEPLNKEDLISQFAIAKKYTNIEERLENASHSIIEHSSSNDLRLRPLLNKSILEPIYKIIKEKKPLSLLAVSVEFSDAHEFTDKQILETIKRLIHKSSPLISLGKGKYLVILDGIKGDEALFIGETLLDVITNTMHIKISMGISSQKKPPYANIHDMIKDAKNALHLAEKKGSFIEISP